MYITPYFGASFPIGLMLSGPSLAAVMLPLPFRCGLLCQHLSQPVYQQHCQGRWSSLPLQVLHVLKWWGWDWLCWLWGLCSPLTDGETRVCQVLCHSVGLLLHLLLCAGKKCQVVSKIKVLQLLPECPLDAIPSLSCGCLHDPVYGQQEIEDILVSLLFALGRYW